MAHGLLFLTPVPRAPSEPLYVSRNHLEGSLQDVPLERVLAACHRHLVTGVVRLHVAGKDGVIELRAGAVDHAHLGDDSGDRAMKLMRAARDGWYEVAQRLPDLTGAIADSSSSLQGDVEGVPLIALMQHCEFHALTCTITVIAGFDRACIEYRAGEIARVELNGFFDDDALPQILDWPDARFRVAAPPLDLDVEGWPVTRRAATAPAFIEKKAPSVPPVPLAPLAGEFDVRPVAARDLLPPPAQTAPIAPARAERYRTGDTERQLRLATAAGPSGSSFDAIWILFAAAVALGLGITSLLLVGYA